MSDSGFSKGDPDFIFLSILNNLNVIRLFYIARWAKVQVFWGHKYTQNVEIEKTCAKLSLLGQGAWNYLCIWQVQVWLNKQAGRHAGIGRKKSHQKCT